MKHNIDWNLVTQSLANGQISKISDFAEMYNMSRPTAKKILKEKYGDGIAFRRGRHGGILFMAAVPPVPQAVTA